MDRLEGGRLFARNQFLKYKHVGRWSGYLVGESTYITLSLVAKCGTLAP